MKLHLRCLVVAFFALGHSMVFSQTDTNNVEIVRDQWGVPHIFGKTDSDVAYGLAWATCEDDFETLQHLMLAANGRLGEVTGKNGALLDFMGHIAQVEQQVDKLFDSSFSEQYLTYLNGYVAGVNRYAETHPEEIERQGLFPITGKDVIKANTLTLVFLTSVYVEIQQIFNRSILLYEHS
ncbi:MAG: acyl-homoserine-lactone acylase, partial [Bacteroidia bacterium]